MSDILHVTWCVTPLHPPRIWRRCKQCNAQTPFYPSGKFRANAQKKRLDVWLIYRCASCSDTWNLPIVERVPVDRIPADELQAFATNDSVLVSRHAFDLARLKRYGNHVDQAPEFMISKRRRSGDPATAKLMVIDIALDRPCRIRLDGLLSQGLGVARSLIRSLDKSATLAIVPANPKALRSPAVDGQAIRIDLKSAIAFNSTIANGSLP